MNDDDYNSNDLADLETAITLLVGRATLDDKGLPVQKYLAAGSTADSDARRALARLLRNGKPLDSLLRMYLAALIDPVASNYPLDPERLAREAQESRPERQIQFRHLGRRNREPDRRTKIAIEVAKLAREYRKLDPAIVEVAQKYGISERTVRSAWADHKNARWARIAVKTRN